MQAHAPERPSRLPVALSAFVGRRGELDAVRAALDNARAVSLVGPGGSGKTRLATELAHDLDDRDPGGVTWVDLAPLTNPATVPRAVANALDVREAPGQPLLDSVIAHLGNEPHLIVLDNCEHLLPDCAELAQRLLHECRQLRILATSREVLGVDGEVVWQVPPLSTPAAGDVTAAALRAAESAQLFAARAQVVRPGFAIDDRNAASI
ncbi:MAG TPA: AAA family ATPase, partial [Jatrophihabitans sp.]|nr:AAA family ATPase [Jatrophihabitans sp.]